jgi:TolB-like protein
LLALPDEEVDVVSFRDSGSFYDKAGRMKVTSRLVNRAQDRALPAARAGEAEA